MYHTPLFRKLTQKKPITLLALGYVVALALIAGMSIGAHLVVQKVISEQESSARTINIAGRQRMLSQRSALFMSDTVKNGDIKAQKILLESINLLERSHKALTNGDVEMRLNGEMTEDLKDIYYREPHNLDAHMRQYISDVRSIINDSENKIAPDNIIFMRAKDMAEHELLESLDAAVKAYEANAEYKIFELSKIQIISVLVILAVIILEAFLIFRPLIQRVREYSEEIEDIASHDMLTGIANRRIFFEQLAIELNRAKRHNHNFCFIICDIDHFKKVNDTYGHGVGDDALIHVADTIKSIARKEDVFARLGGEEFAVLLPMTDISAGAAFAEKIRLKIESSPLTADSPQGTVTISLTLSLGVTAYNSAKDNEADDIYQRADIALYEAKNQGRNRIAVA